MSDFNNLLKQGKEYIGNPLGVIALFVLLIYGFACLVLGVGAGGLESSHKTILIYFLVLFPVVILISFVYLVTKHSYKLYAPKDYKDEENYMETLDFIQMEMRSNQKIKLLLQEEVEKVNKDEDTVGNSTGQAKVEVASAIEEINNNQLEYARIYSLKKKYELFEELALERIEEELGVEVKRRVGLENRADMGIGFDGIAIKEEQFFGIEVKYTRRNEISAAMRQSIIGISRATKSLFKQNLIKFGDENKLDDRQCQFILIIVHEIDDTERIEEQLNLLLDNFEIPASYSLFNVNELLNTNG